MGSVFVVFVEAPRHGPPISVEPGHSFAFAEFSVLSEHRPVQADRGRYFQGFVGDEDT